MEYRQAALADLDRLVEVRMDFLSAVRPGQVGEGFRQATRRYLEAHLEQPDFIAYLAVEGDRVAAVALACVFDLLPLPACPTGRQAELLNVYTHPAHRRRGHAEALLRRLMAEAKSRGVEKLLLFYTDEGLPLYEKLGFVHAARDMELQL